jgi:hypothetical protein
VALAWLVLDHGGLTASLSVLRKTSWGCLYISIKSRIITLWETQQSPSTIGYTFLASIEVLAVVTGLHVGIIKLDPFPEHGSQGGGIVGA